VSSITLRSGEIRESGYGIHPGYQVTTEAAPHRWRAELAGLVIAESAAARILYETRHDPVVYFPREAIAWEHFEASARSTYCPFKGEAWYWTFRSGSRLEEDILWGYPDPFPKVPELARLVAFYPGRVERWLRDGVEVARPSYSDRDAADPTR